jgi:hypothetical protein
MKTVLPHKIIKGGATDPQYLGRFDDAALLLFQSEHNHFFFGALFGLNNRINY